MPRAVEGVETVVRIIVGDDDGTRRSPTTSDADPHVRIGLQVLYVTRVLSVLGDDPPGAVLDVHPYDGAPPLARAPAVGLEEHVARHESGPHNGLDRRVEDIALHESHPSPLPNIPGTAHPATMPNATEAVPNDDHFLVDREAVVRHYAVR